MESACSGHDIRWFERAGELQKISFKASEEDFVHLKSFPVCVLYASRKFSANGIESILLLHLIIGYLLNIVLPTSPVSEIDTRTAVSIIIQIIEFAIIDRLDDLFNLFPP